MPWAEQLSPARRGFWASRSLQGACPLLLEALACPVHTCACRTRAYQCPTHPHQQPRRTAPCAAGLAAPLHRVCGVCVRDVCVCLPGAPGGHHAARLRLWPLLHGCGRLTWVLPRGAQPGPQYQACCKSPPRLQVVHKAWPAFAVAVLRSASLLAGLGSCCRHPCGLLC